MVFDDFARSFKAEYELFALALTGLYYQRTVSSATAPVHELQSKALVMRDSFLKSAGRAISSYEQSIAIGESLKDNTTFFSVLSNVTLQNVAQIVSLARAATLNGFSGMSGGMGELVNKRFTSPELTARVGQKSYQAANHIYTNARHFAYIEALKSKIVEISISSDLARILYPNPEHANNGLVFSISGNTAGYPSMDSISGSVFHYNSTAWVENV